MTKYYFMPWCRIGPYIVGILAGYILYRNDGKIKMNKVTISFFIGSVKKYVSTYVFVA